MLFRSLSHAIAKGVIKGLTGKELRFVVTRKAQNATSLRRNSSSNPLKEEQFLLLALAATGAIFCLTPAFQKGVGLGTPALWLVLMALQALPYISALMAQSICERGGHPHLSLPAQTTPHRQIS